MVLDEALRVCESEPIHIPGSIQPHGLLLGIDPIGFRVVLATENVAEFLGLAPEEALGSDLARVVGRSVRDRIERLAVDHDLSYPQRFLASIDRDGSEWLAEASVHRQGPLLVLELERADPAGTEEAIELSSWIRRFSHGAGEASPLVQSLQSVAREVRELSGYDRTMIYRFHPDDHGEVIAESARPDLEPYLGLHYPASDIPRQARELYVRSRVRVLIDVHARAVPLSSKAGLSPAGPLDMTFCQLRSFSPVHLEYLDNMGVQASLVTSILQGDRLWGLLVCHHHQAPRKPSHAMRAACNFLSELISVEVVGHEDREQLRAQRAVSDLQRRILGTVMDGTDWMDMILVRPDPCRSPIPSNGMAIVEETSVRSVGTVPDEATIRELCTWIAREHPGPIFSTDALGEREPAFAGLESAIGLLSVEIGPALRTYLIWFRQELIREVSWGGDPSKGLVVGEEGARLSPRKSFDAWSATILGRSAPWESGDITAAREIRAAIIEVVMLASLLGKADAEIELVRTRRAVEAAGEAILIADARGRPMFVNQAFIKLFGAKLEDLPERSVCAPILELALGEEILAATLGVAGSWRGEVEIPNPEGGTIPIALGIDSVLNETGVVLGFIAIHFDLTERHRVRRDLEEHARRLEAARDEIERQSLMLAEARDKAEAANRAKGAFLATMSHEIRTPMNGVLGMTDLLLDTPLNDLQRDYARTVHNSGEALLTVINDILDFSKIEAGKLTLELVEFDLRTLMGEVATLLAAGARKKGLELSCRVARDVPGRLVGDPIRIRQILTNLAGNAVKFTDRGEVIMEAHLLAEDGDRMTLRVLVRDTGIGIPADRQADIFEDFTQIEGGDGRPRGGTGLGLTICRSLVALMGGRIGLESRIGEGSTFWFEVALARGHGEADPATTEFDGVRVLVVVAQQAEREALGEWLLSWKCRTELVASGPEALARLLADPDDGPFGVILLDQDMPGMDGEQAARVIRAMPRSANLPLVQLISPGQRGGEAAEDGLWAARVSKPAQRSLLHDALRRAVSTPGSPDPRPPTADSGMEGPLPSLRILLVEDNEVNRRVAIGMLERLGCRVEAVGDGREALETLDYDRHDLILMDVQMPVMDGLAATAAIRDRERGTDRHIPIVAMTAFAMQGDRERCLAAGADGYVSKPIRPGPLREALQARVVAGERASFREGRDRGSELPSFSPKVLGEMCGENPKLMREVLEIMLRGFPAQMRRLEAAVVARDGGQRLAQAHSLGGAVASVGAVALARRARC
jgi:PAS domain S-box-containing protein